MPDRPTHLRTHRRGAAGDGPGEIAGNPGSAPASDAPTVEELKTQLDAARAMAAEHLASLQRTAADFANFKRRSAEDRERELGLASESLLRKLLAVADDFDRALDAMPADFEGLGWIEGIVLLDRKLRALLESEGVTPIEAIGRPFDPREHEAIASVPATGRPDGEVVAELQRGYRVRDRVLRPAMVAVAGGGFDAPDAITRSN
ncbi:MAG: nucleotide exchange factor GrpE [Candidatus Limnocylindrales bacterium]